MQDNNKPDGITVILLSWKRTHNITTIISELKKNPLIKEIIIWNNNPDIKLAVDTAIVINSSKNFRAYARYGAALLATYPTILFQDDDIVVSRNSIEALYNEYLKYPHCIYGALGRNLENGRYTKEDVYGECDIILGQFMLFSKELLAKVYGDILRLTPFERGDDIAFSLLCGVKHKALVLKGANLGGDDNVSLWLEPGHFEKRQQMVQRVFQLRQSKGHNQ